MRALDRPHCSLRIDVFVFFFFIISGFVMIIIIILRARVHPQFCIQIVWVVFVTCSLTHRHPPPPGIIFRCNNIIQVQHTHIHASAYCCRRLLLPPPFRVPHALIIISEGIIISTVTNFSIFFFYFTFFDSPRRRARACTSDTAPLSPPFHPPVTTHTHTHTFMTFFFFIPS